MAFMDIPGFGILGVFLLTTSTWNITGESFLYILLFLYQTYIGSILCAVNPYYAIEGLYDKSMMATYREKHIGELPPHVYAIANECYYSMWKKGESQCVLIR